MGILGDYFSVRDVANDIYKRGDLIYFQIYERMSGDLTSPAIYE